jgi:EmrB/QacA subfamily drug resistance transporter
MKLTQKLQQPRYRWVGLAFLSIALLTVSMNNSILNVSMPVIAVALDASTSDLQWIEDSYILVFSALLLSMGMLGDRYGRKRFLMWGMVAFGAFSIMAALAQGTIWVIVARALQGAGGAVVMPSTLSLISAMFRDANDRSKAIAIWSAMFGVGYGIGPLVGGALLNLPWFNWQGIFLINLPLGLIFMVGGAFFIPESYHPSSNRIDLPGVALSFTGLFSLIYAIIAAGEHGWSAPDVLAWFGTAVVFTAVFVWWENRTPHAMLPLTLFRNPSFTLVSITMMFISFGLSGLFFFLPLFLQGIQGYTPLQTGLLLMPQSIISVLVSWNSHHIIRWIGVRGTMLTGLTLMASGMALVAITIHPAIPYGLILVGLIMIIAGIDSSMPAGTVSIMSSVPEEKAGIGSAMNEMAINIGGALGIAVLGAILNRVYQLGVTPLAEQVSPEVMDSIANSIFSAHKALANLDGGAALIVVVDNAFVDGMRAIMVVCAVLFSVLAVLVRIYLPRKVQQAELEIPAA